jgi:hypothetical protein
MHEHTLLAVPSGLGKPAIDRLGQVQIVGCGSVNDGVVCCRELFNLV